MSYPATYSAYHRSEGTKAPEGGRLAIQLSTDERLPSELQDHDVVIKIHAVSLNYREIAMVIGTYPKPISSGGIPTSDAAAEVIAIGSAVTRFKIGDRVTPNANIGDSDPDDDSTSVALGVNTDGVLREYAVFHEKHLVPLPAHLTWEEASTLACAGVTAWNALDSLSYIPKNATALLQGTGGVSMFALLLCLSAGITPLITSSSDAKLADLRSLNPNILTLNYKSCPDQVAEVMRLTNNRGVDFIVNNTGVRNLMDEIDMLTERNGTISLVGFLEGFDAEWAPSGIFKLMSKAAKLKGISMGTKKDFEDLNRFVEEKGVQLSTLVPGENVFGFGEAKAAYEKLESGRFVGKVVVKVAQ